MIPVSLKIKGLYSFQEEQHIDFTNLIDAKLFGIFGTVGSGKSTILEAISFALFGSTERLNSRDNRNYNMMNLKSDELLIDFEFLNHDDFLYRFVIKGKRHGSEFGKVNTFSRNAYRQEAGSWIPLGGITAEEIIGLSYENFRRTIIIPQGQFQEFLGLGDKDRTNMLKELFHLDKYDFFFQTTSLEKKNNEQIQYLSGQLAQYESVTPENIAQQAAEVQILQEGLTASRQELETKKAVEKEQSELQKLFNELKTKQDILSQLKLREPAIEEQEKMLGRYESCVGLFKNLIEASEDTRKRLQEKQQTLAETQQQQLKLDESLAANQQQFAQVEAEFRKLDDKKQEISDYRQLKVVLRLSGEIYLLEQRMAAGEAKLKEEDAARQKLQQEIADSRKSLQEARANQPNLVEMTEVKAWFTQKNAILKNRDAILKEKAGFEAKLTEKQLALEIPASLIADLALDARQAADYYIEKLENQQRLNATKSEAIGAMNSHLLLQEKLEAYTQDLHDGEPCPLCGSLHHPEVMSVENVKEQRESNDARLENVRKQNVLIDQVVRQLNENLSAQQAFQMQVQSSQQRLEEEAQALKKHEATFKWPTFRAEDEAAFDAVFEQSKAASNRILDMQKEQEALEARLQKAEENFNTFNRLLQEIRDQFTVKHTEKETILSQIKAVDPQNFTSGETVLDEHIATLEKLVLSVSQQYETLSGQIREQQQQQSVLKERAELTQASVAEYGQQLEKLQNELTENLEKSEFDTVEQVTALLRQEIDTKALRETIHAFRQQFFKSSADVAELEQKAVGKSFSAESYTALLEEIQALEKTVQAQHNFHITQSAVLEKMKADFASKQELHEKMEGFRRRAENIQTMKSLFKGSGFVNYVSTVYLQNLCKMANVRFHKLTRQQLRLEIGEGNEFQVRDFLNDGKVRSVKTLSGGQMFQAALSLALALAESIQQQNRAKQNFFFLDEGFGSQDKASLQMVFDSLKALREENRVIGVISHVEELQQEIDMYLKLENDPETGSRIEESWN